MTRVCIICGEEEISERSRLAIGPNCRSSMHRWADRPLQARIDRRNTLRKYDARMAMVDDTAVIKPAKKDAPKYLSDEAYMQLTKYTFIKKEKAPEPPREIKRKPGKVRLKVSGGQIERRT